MMKKTLYFITFLTIFGCGHTEPEPKQNCLMIQVSAALPVKVYLNGETTFNEEEHTDDGIEKFCFNQEFECDDSIKFQIFNDEDDAMSVFIKDQEGNTLSIDTMDKSDEFFEYDFMPSEHGICNEKIKIEFVNSNDRYILLPPLSSFINESTGGNEWSTGVNPSVIMDGFPDYFSDNLTSPSVYASGVGDFVFNYEVDITDPPGTVDMFIILYKDDVNIGQNSIGIDNLDNRVGTITVTSSDTPDRVAIRIEQSLGSSTVEVISLTSPEPVFDVVGRTEFFKVANVIGGNVAVRYRAIKNYAGLRYIDVPNTTINSILSWQDLGNGAGTWATLLSGKRITLGAFQTSAWLADNIVAPFVGNYQFSFSADGTIAGGLGKTGQLTVHFLDEDENIINSSDPVDIPNAGAVNVPITLDSTPNTPFYVMLQVNNSTGSSNQIRVTNFRLLNGVKELSYFMTRIPGRFFHPRKAGTTTSMELSNNKFITTSTKLLKKRLLQIEDAPEYFHDMIELILNHAAIGQVLINGVEWERAAGDDYTISEDTPDSYPLYRAEVVLSRKDWIKRNVI